jgi:Mg/Co/Ni transporter MgtE
MFFPFQTGLFGYWALLSRGGREEGIGIGIVIGIGMVIVIAIVMVVVIAGGKSGLPPISITIASYYYFVSSVLPLFITSLRATLMGSCFSF